MAETSVSVKVQHDSSIHEGVCYHLGGNFRQRSKVCVMMIRYDDSLHGLITSMYV